MTRSVGLPSNGHKMRPARLVVLLLTVFNVILGTTTKTIPPMDDGEVRILKGYACTTNDYPFMVMIARKHGINWTLMCGGTLISPKWVLTAAHCLEEGVTLGILAGVDGPETKLSLVKAKHKHPGYDASEFYNDIAVVELQTPFEPTQHISPVQIITTIHGDDTKVACPSGLIMGWGGTAYGNVSSLKGLQCAKVPLITIQECHQMYHEHFNVDVTWDNMCTLSTEGIDACQGDSGGPLLCDGIQVGIISWGIECGKPNSPGVYVRIDKYLGFIYSVIDGVSRPGPVGGTILCFFVGLLWLAVY